jgi:predicted anti-sigma-YlaC factor YlaD
MIDHPNANRTVRSRRGAFSLVAACAAACLLASGCASPRKMAINMVGNALAGTGTAFASDPDPELIREAVPFGLKLMEALLAETPEHKGLLLAATSGFTQYAYAFVQPDADKLEDEDFDAAEATRLRAKKLYLRARGYGLRSLETRHKGFSEALLKNPEAAVARAQKKDVPYLYWTAASWGAAISLGLDDPELIADVPAMQALIDRALELDESYDAGAIHSFLIGYEMIRQGAEGDPEERAREHFKRAVELSEGMQAGAYVALAESVSVETQNKKEFNELLDKALAVDVDAKPEWRLLNIVMQRRAQWLLGRSEDLFLE